MLTETEWIEQFQPLPNHIDDNASYQIEDTGCLFETYGRELRHVKSCDPKSIWTLLEIDGEPWIVSGFHYVNRLGYFVTKKQFDCEVTVRATP